MYIYIVYFIFVAFRIKPGSWIFKLAQKYSGSLRSLIRSVLQSGSRCNSTALGHALTRGGLAVCRRFAQLAKRCQG